MEQNATQEKSRERQSEGFDFTEKPAHLDERVDPKIMASIRETDEKFTLILKDEKNLQNELKKKEN